MNMAWNLIAISHHAESADVKIYSLLSAHRQGSFSTTIPQARGKPAEYRGLLSMAARNSPESSGRNSPLHSDLVTAKPPRRSDIGKAVEVEIDDVLKRLSGGAVTQAFG
jgi:hypothetical protein